MSFWHPAASSVTIAPVSSSIASNSGISFPNGTLNPSLTSADRLNRAGTTAGGRAVGSHTDLSSPHAARAAFNGAAPGNWVRTRQELNADSGRPLDGHDRP